MSLLSPLLLRCYATLARWQDAMATRTVAGAVAQFGAGSFVRHRAYIHGGEFVRIGSGFVSGPGLRLEAQGEYAGQQHAPSIVIGDRVIAMFNLHVGAVSSVEIGDDTLIGSNVLITDHQHGEVTAGESAVPPRDRPLSVRGPVKIGKRVWIGENACIFSGVEIGDGSVIGANAVVTKSVPPGSVVIGAPGRVIKNDLTSQISERKLPENRYTRRMDFKF